MDLDRGGNDVGTLGRQLMSSNGSALGQYLTACRDRALDTRAVHVVVRDHANGVFVRRSAQDLLFGKIVADFRGGASRFAYVENHDVGDHTLRVDRDAAHLPEPLREKLRV